MKLKSQLPVCVISFFMWTASYLPVEAVEDKASSFNELEVTESCVSGSGQDSRACKISCVAPYVSGDESKKVLDVLQALIKGYAEGDLKSVEGYLDDNCTTFNESTGKLVTGKANVLADLKRKFEKHSPSGECPLLSFTIDQPYVKVVGDMAVVNFVAYRETGGKHPVKEKSQITDIFVKRGDTWKKLHYRGAWKKVS